MAEASDFTMPGPAGLFFSCEELNEAGWLVEHEARFRLERWCQGCGQSACYGFGVTLKDIGAWSCSDASCIASAEAEIARRNCPSPPPKPSNAEATRDLFGEAA